MIENVLSEQTLHLDCADCGNARQFAVINVAQGFFVTGWQVDYSRRQPAFVCGTCRGRETANALRSRQSYLAHLFEAQWRFGE